MIIDQTCLEFKVKKELIMADVKNHTNRTISTMKHSEMVASYLRLEDFAVVIEHVV